MPGRVGHGGSAARKPSACRGRTCRRGGAVARTPGTTGSPHSRLRGSRLRSPEIRRHATGAGDGIYGGHGAVSPTWHLATCHEGGRWLAAFARRRVELFSAVSGWHTCNVRWVSGRTRFYMRLSPRQRLARSLAWCLNNRWRRHDVDRLQQLLSGRRTCCSWGRARGTGRC